MEPERERNMADVLFLFVTDGAEYHQGIAMISAFLRRHGFSSALCMLDLRRGEDAMKQAIDSALERNSPSMIAVSAMSCHWDVTRKAIAWCRETTRAPILVGGWHSTLEPEAVMQDPFVDFCCVGEGEMATLDLIRALRGTQVNASTIANIWSRNGIGITRNDPRPPLDDLDVLPFPDRELFNFSDLLDRNAMSIMGADGPPRVAPLSAGRGCPYKCSYCSNAAWMKQHGLPVKNFIRRRTVDNVLEEVDSLIREYTPLWLEFWDEDFTLDREWLQDFCRQYPRHAAIPFAVLARPNNVQANEFALLSDAGCRLVFMGIESGDEQYRRERLGRQVSNKQIVDAFARARAAGIATASFNMVGLPWESETTMKETLRINEMVRPDFFLCFTYVPFPNTDLYIRARESGMLREDAAVNYGGRGTPNVKGIDERIFNSVLDRAQELQAELKQERISRYPDLFTR